MDKCIKQRFDFYDFFGHYNDSEGQRKLSETVQSGSPYYFALGMPTDNVTYEDLRRSIKHRTQPCYMNFTVFRIVSVTPAKTHRSFFNNETVIDQLPSMLFETTSGQRMEAFQEYETDRYGKSRKNLMLSDAVFEEINRNFVHPKLNLNNFHLYSAVKGPYGEQETVYFEKIYNVPEEYGRWKETVDRQYKFFDEYFARLEQQETQRQNQRLHEQQQAEADSKRFTETFYRDLGSTPDTPETKVFFCPSCKTGCRVPAVGKRIEITCPNPACRSKFIVFS